MLDHVLGGPDYARPATTFIALFTSAPSDGGGGTEVSGGAYGRVSYTNTASSPANWPAASAGQKKNGNAITFNQATANWGTVVAFAIFDAATAGNMLIWGDLTTSKTINNGDTATFSANDLIWTED